MFIDSSQVFLHPFRAWPPAQEIKALLISAQCSIAFSDRLFRLCAAWAVQKVHIEMGGRSSVPSEADAVIRKRWWDGSLFGGRCQHLFCYEHSITISTFEGLSWTVCCYQHCTLWCSSSWSEILQSKTGSQVKWLRLSVVFSHTTTPNSRLNHLAFQTRKVKCRKGERSRERAEFRYLTSFRLRIPSLYYWNSRSSLWKHIF